MQGGSSSFSPSHPIFPWNQFVQNVFKNQKVKENSMVRKIRGSILLQGEYFKDARQLAMQRNKRKGKLKNSQSGQ